MRHHVFGKKLNRDANHRKQMMRTMVSQLLINGHMITTVAKAQVVTNTLEKLITKAKNPTLAIRRQIMAALNNEKAVKYLVDVLAPHQIDIQGGHIKMVRQGMRTGDSAMMVRLDLPVIKTETETDKKATKTETEPKKAAKKETKEKVSTAKK
jgi:large subunit ribosomal protein L17